ncbi:MAG: hypothetical protein ACD_73C00005G0002, partial [uncultured bacterium]
MVVLLTGLLFIVFPATGFTSVGLKMAVLWNQTISYELVTIQKNRVGYDGLSFITHRGKKTINRAVINTINFKKEALAIWKDFEKNPNQFSGTVISLADLIRHLEVVHDDGWGTSHMQKRDLLKIMAELEKQLQYVSWYGAYHRIRENSPNGNKAQKEFISEFEKTRKQTIEYHELSHLVDATNSGETVLETGKSNLSGELSEVRAFITELAYGQNPADTLWQMVAGVIDEINQGQNVDSSIFKMKLVLGEVQKRVPMQQTDNAITCLCGLSRQHSQEIALALYRQSE